MRFKKSYFAAASAAVLFLVGAAAYLALSPADGGAADDAGRMGMPFAVPVEAEPVRIDIVTSEISAVGSLESNESVVIQPEISGRISAIRFGEGERVEKGTVLIEIDREILDAELERAEAQLKLAQANFERADQLAEQGTGTARARDEALAELRARRASYNLAQARLNKATITAPFTGTLGLRSVSVGAFVEPGDRIVNLEDIDTLKVAFRIPEVNLPEIDVGQAVELRVDARPGQTFNGEVYAIDPLVDENGRAIRMRAKVPNNEALLKPGLFARVNLIVDVRPKAVLVPESAIVPDRDGPYVYRVVDGKAVRTPVELGRRRPGEVEVRKGLGRDDIVVTTGQMRLRDGAPVDVVPSGTPVGS